MVRGVARGVAASSWMRALLGRGDAAAERADPRGMTSSRRPCAAPAGKGPAGGRAIVAGAIDRILRDGGCSAGTISQILRNSMKSGPFANGAMRFTHADGSTGIAITKGECGETAVARSCDGATYNPFRRESQERLFSDSSEYSERSADDTLADGDFERLASRPKNVCCVGTSPKSLGESDCCHSGKMIAERDTANRPSCGKRSKNAYGDLVKSDGDHNPLTSRCNRPPMYASVACQTATYGASGEAGGGGGGGDEARGSPAPSPSAKSVQDDAAAAPAPATRVVLTAAAGVVAAGAGAGAAAAANVSEMVEALGDVFQWIAQSLAAMQRTMGAVNDKMERTDETVRDVAQRLKAQRKVIQKLDKRMCWLEGAGGRARVGGSASASAVAFLRSRARPRPHLPCGWGAGRHHNAALARPSTPSSPAACSTPLQPPPLSPLPPNTAQCRVAFLGDERAAQLGVGLLKAAQQGRTEVVRALLDDGADVNFNYGLNWTALHMAAKAHPVVVGLLLKKGARVNARTTNGFSPLHIAAYFDFGGRCVQQLVDGGCDLDARNQCGWTPLHYAAACGNEAAVAVLLQAGASCAEEDAEGRTPPHVAGSPRVKQLMAAHVGADDALAPPPAPAPARRAFHRHRSQSPLLLPKWRH